MNISLLVHARRATSLVALSVISLPSAGCSSQPEPQSVPSAPALADKPEEPVFVAGPSADEIRQEVDSNNTALRQCYMMGTFRNSQLAGTVNVVFTIESSGKVSETNDGGSDMSDPEVVQCVLGVFAQMEFRAGATSATEVTYPITFGG